MSVDLILAAVAPPAVGLPIWVTVLGIVLASLVVPAVQYVNKRNEIQAGTRTTATSAQLTEVTALGNTISTLATENTRLADRNARLDVYIDQLTGELGQEPTRDQLLRSVQRLRDQVKGLGEKPINGLPVPQPPPGKA